MTLNFIKVVGVSCTTVTMSKCVGCLPFFLSYVRLNWQKLDNHDDLYNEVAYHNADNLFH